MTTDAAITIPDQLYPNGCFVGKTCDLTQINKESVCQQLFDDEGGVTVVGWPMLPELKPFPGLNLQWPKPYQIRPFEPISKVPLGWPSAPFKGHLEDISYDFYDLVKNVAESSTEPAQAALSEKTIEKLFDSARFAIFEDGKESDFSRQLVSLILHNGNEAISKVTNLISSGRAPASVAAEALRWFGQMRDSNTHADRLWLLEYCLNHQNPIVRDGAVVGLGLLDDQHSRTYVESAIQNEAHPELLRDLRQLLEQLKEPEKNYALSFKGDT